MSTIKSITTAAVLSALASISFAEGNGHAWTLDPALSNVSFSSVKNDYIGETHTFEQMNGFVSGDGTVTLSIGLASVDTGVDIRNERFVEYVFNNMPEATITAQLDMAALSELAVGDMANVETVGTLALLGTESDLDASFFVMRLSEDRVLVTSDGMIMLSMDEIGIDTGIDKLQELAGLDSISRVSPVSLRLVFDAEL